MGAQHNQGPSNTRHLTLTQGKIACDIQGAGPLVVLVPGTGESLDSVNAPTLVVMGDKDPDFKDPRAEADWIRGALGGKTVMVEDVATIGRSRDDAT